MDEVLVISEVTPGRHASRDQGHSVHLAVGVDVDEVLVITEGRARPDATRPHPEITSTPCTPRGAATWMTCS
ncbi:hypothetical protein ACFPK1_15345 [Actinomycetospora rhizophila]|uniref:Uncharacterized protein n=1 Tax=Actinomycetospora rhizophila TaxID=1416876 RepID=A0ABV9ZGQ8_9PSEU